MTKPDRTHTHHEGSIHSVWEGGDIWIGQKPQKQANWNLWHVIVAVWLFFTKGK